MTATDRHRAGIPVAAARIAAAALIALMIGAASGPAYAQGASATNIIGFSGRSTDPIRIGAEILDVDNKRKTALLSGNVVVVQADVTLRTKQLRVNFEGDLFASERAQFTSMEALDKILVEKEDRVLTGDRGRYELKTNTITVEGNVVLSQGKNVLRGSRLVVDLNADKYRLEAHRGTEGGRVSGSFIPDSPRSDASGDQPPSQ